MRAIAILWNSMENNFDEALSDIKRFSEIQECFKINFDNNFDEFISDIYPYSGDQKWKLDYKINIMNNKYTKNEVMILFLEIPNSNKIYCERKKTFLYENIENLKEFIRSKYKVKVKNYSFDNVFHMTDDELEYEKTLQIIKKHLMISFINSNQGFINLNNYLGNDRQIVEKNELNGKRDKFWFADNLFMYKKAKEDSYELYSELFVDEMARILGLECAKYIPTIYNNSAGLTTLNFAQDDEILIDGSHIIDFNITGEINRQLVSPIESICKFNNFEVLPSLLEKYCLKNDLEYDDNLIDHLKKVFVFDAILLQTDRNPNNWGVLINKKSRKIKIAPLYDNSNIMGMNKRVEQVFKLDLEGIYKLPTMMIYNFGDSFFEHKLDAIKKIDDNYIISIFNEYLSKIRSINIDTIFSNIEYNYNIVLPESFKCFIKSWLCENINNLDSIIKVKQKVK